MSNLKQHKMKTTQLIMLVLLVCGTALTGTAQEIKKEKKHRAGTHNYFDIDLGINNFLENGNSPDDNDELYAVKPFGSWYVALKSVNDTHIVGSVHLLWGADVSWYNFKFQNESVRIQDGVDQLVFVEETGDFSPVKSKLTAAYINASFVPMLKFGEQPTHKDRFHWHNWDEEPGFRIGAGVYAGYKIASYAKYVTEVNGDKEKDKDKDAFYLNNFRYGVRMQMGYKGMDVFINYDLNELFVENKGPKLNAFSFGVVL